MYSMSTKIIVEQFYGLFIGGTAHDEMGTGTVALSETKGQTEDSFDEVDAGMRKRKCTHLLENYVTNFNALLIQDTRNFI